MFLVLIGLLVTIVWLFGGVWYISESGGLEMLAMLLPNEVGDFLTGLFAPLAFIWLIIGYLHFSLRLRRIENGLWDVSAVRIPRADEQPTGAPLEKQGSWLDPPPDEEPPPDKGPPAGPPAGGSSPPSGGTPPDKAPPPERAPKSKKGASSKRGGSAKTSSRYRTAAWPQGDRAAWATPPPSGESRPGRRFAASATRYPPSSQSSGVSSSGLFGASSTTKLGRSLGPPPDQQTSKTQGERAAEPREPPPRVPPPEESSPGEPPPGRTPAGAGMASEVFDGRFRRQLADEPPAGGNRPVATESGAAGTSVARSSSADPQGASAPPPEAEALPPQAVAAPPQEFVTDVVEPEASPPVLGETVAAPPPAPPSSSSASSSSGTSASPEEERPFVPPWPGSQVPPEVMQAESPAAPEPTVVPEPPAQVPKSRPEVASAVPEAPLQSPTTEIPAAEGPAAEGPAAGRPLAAEPTPAAQAPAAETPPPAAEAKPVGFRHLVRITSMELNTISMDLASLLCRESDRAVALKGYDKGEKDVFFGLLSETLAERDPKEVLQTLQETGADSRLGSYMRKFEALAEESKRVDKSGALAKSLEALPIGRLYQRIRAIKTTASAA